MAIEVIDSVVFIGSRGPQGIPGQGVPTGGTTGQSLVKASGSDYDVTWEDRDSTISIASANGFAGTVTAPGTTPVITLETTIDGILYGNGESISVATEDNIAATLGNQTQHYFYAAPAGSLGLPDFRAIVVSDVPTLNQNTTGSAATLTTPRAIYGNNFDGSAALTQIIASTYGGTGNGFTKFSGALTSEKTYTLPNASTTILTTNAAVTVAQGGTGQASYTNGQLLIGNTSGNTLTKSTLTGTSSRIDVSNGAGSITLNISPSYDTLVSVKTYGAVGDGTTDDTAAFLAALATGNSIFVPRGTYLLSSTITVSAQNLVGAGSQIAKLITNSAIIMVSISSNATVTGLLVEGNNFATKGIYSAPIGVNKCTISDNRVQHCAHGIELLDTQNSTLFNNQVVWCDVNYYFDGIENCKWYNNNGSLSTSERTVTSASRNLIVTNALYGTVRNLNMWGGILERGNLVNTYGTEITGAQISCEGVEFNDGGTALIRLNAGVSALFDTCNFSMTTTNYCISCDNTSTYEVRAPRASGSAINGQTQPFLSYFDALCVGGVKVDTPLLDQRFDYSANGWGANGGSTAVYTAATRSLDVTTSGSTQGIVTSYIGAHVPFDTDYYTGRYYRIDCLITDISTGNPVSLLATSLPSGSRSLGTISQGYSTQVFPADATDGGGFLIRANEAGAKTWKMRYFRATLI